MAAKVNLPVRGVIENMSWFTGDDGKRYEIFGSGGGQILAEELEVPLLGRLPLDARIREQTDSGIPTVISDPDSAAAAAYRATAIQIAAELAPQRTDYSSKFGNIVVEGMK